MNIHKQWDIVSDWLIKSYSWAGVCAILRNCKVLSTRLKKYGILLPSFNFLCFFAKNIAEHVINYVSENKTFKARWALIRQRHFISQKPKIKQLPLCIISHFISISIIYVAKVTDRFDQIFFQKLPFILFFCNIFILFFFVRFCLSFSWKQGLMLLSSRLAWRNWKAFRWSRNTIYLVL